MGIGANLLGHAKGFLSLTRVAVMANLPPDLAMVTYLGNQFTFPTWSPRRSSWELSRKGSLGVQGAGVHLGLALKPGPDHTTSALP